VLIARVVVDVPLAHLDRPFDYAVPEKFADTVQAGCRVRVRFHGRLVDGVVWELGDTTEFAGALQPLSHVPSGEPVLTPQVARLARVVADRYAGTLSDVLRLALPPRRAAAEKRT
jgi:primosomal protein N' (replication factor Y) (superfamily II helicase)